MRDEPDFNSAGEALRMLDLYAGFGVKAVDLTFTDCTGRNIAARFRRAISIDAIQQRIHAILTDATQLAFNVIIRPWRAPVAFLQLDDLNGESIEVLRPIAFMTIATSPGNYQSWLAFTQPADKTFARRLRRHLGADPAASGATRLAGSLNFKTKYAPDFPRVSVVHSFPQRLTTTTEVEHLHLLAPETAYLSSPLVGQREPKLVRKAWPSYARCLRGAPINRDGTARDISVCDFMWCMIAIDWGWPIEATADRLMSESRKAQAEGPRYARRTAERAAQAVAGNRARRRLITPD